LNFAEIHAKIKSKVLAVINWHHYCTKFDFWNYDCRWPWFDL